MRIKFLQTAPSASPDAPFQPGQIVDVATLTPELRAALQVQSDGSVLAVVLPEGDDAIIAATMVAPERAVRERAKARTA